MNENDYKAKHPVPVRMAIGCLRVFSFMTIEPLGRWLTALVVKGATGDPTERQQQRDEVAHRIVHETLRGHALRESYIVFLRSFTSDGAMVVRAKDSAWMLLTSDGNYEQAVDLETALIDALWQFAPVVALAGDKQQFGAGRASIPASAWERAVIQLVSGADTVIIVPGVSGGVQREYQILSETGAITKTIFVAPPCEVDAEDAARKAWQRASEAVRGAISVVLPDYDPRGCLVTVGSDGHPDGHVTLPSTMTPGALSKALRELLTQVSNRAG